MTENPVFKNLDKERDVLYIQTIEKESLFYPFQAIVKPYDSSNNLTIEQINEPDPEDTLPSIYSRVDVVKGDTSAVPFFSYGSADKNDTDETELLYHKVKQLTRPDMSDFFIQEGNSIDRFDVIALSREFYKDQIDPDFFTVFINTESSTPTTSTPPTFSRVNDILALVPSSEVQQSKIGEKRYLYPNMSTSTYYTKSSDSIDGNVVMDRELLDLSVPYGEVFVDAGIIVLFTEVIELEYPNISTLSTLHFVAGIGGRSEIQLNSALYYLRLYNQEFNYTTNRSFYEDDNENIIKREFREDPVTFITTVGLYNDSGELIAVGKLSKPIEKSFEKEAIIYAQLSL